MTSVVDKRLSDQYEGLKECDEEINNILISVKDDSALKQLITTAISNANQSQLQSINEDDRISNLNLLSLNQLNTKLESTEKHLYQLNSLNEITTSFNEIEKLINNLEITPNSLLDLQYLNDLFKKIQLELSSSHNSNYVIYKQITRKIVRHYQQYMEILNDYLKIIIPNEFSITNVSLLNDFNSFLIKNDFQLKLYNSYKLKYDGIVDEIYRGYNEKLNNKYGITLIEKEDGNRVEMNFTNNASNSNEDNSFILAYGNFIKFINQLNHKPTKQFLNTKISKNLNNLVFKNINTIINNDLLISQLNNLIKECESNDWKVLFTVGNNETIEEKLKELHLDWTIDKYINKIRDLINGTNFSETKEIEDEFDLIQEEPKNQELNLNGNPEDDNDDGWNESWDDGWDQDNEDENKISEEKVKPRSSSTSNVITISTLPESLLNIYKDFSNYSTNFKYLNLSIESISPIKYPSLKNSFLIYNDLLKLSKDIQDSSFITYANDMWNQVLIQFYQELKILILSINFEHEEVLDEDEDEESTKQLNDYNLNQLSLIYQWFRIFFEEKSLKATNFQKFKVLIIELIEFCNNLVISVILNFDDISEYQCTLISLIISNLNNITVSYLSLIETTKDEINSFNKLNNINFLLNNHLKDIMDRFYNGELFDLSTNEIIKLLTSIFLKSEIRDNYINEIIEFRNMTEDD
ncbi:DSL1 [Candida jiufengensis]|uniref:DSL1 n=1 Tax=Candida jiufengensis TaxID=497108 RepID=UPI00222441ED|nr:DSL1 [Candida jiufengensis]KAI5957102.1 DSL1 [Candida jiufengensis]